MEAFAVSRVRLADSEASLGKVIIAALSDRLGNITAVIGHDDESGLITPNTALFFGANRQPRLTRLDTTYDEYTPTNTPSPYGERRLFPDRSGTTILRANTTDDHTAHFVQYTEHGTVIGYAWRPSRNAPGTVEQLYPAHDLLGWEGATLTLEPDGDTLRVTLNHSFS